MKSTLIKSAIFTFLGMMLSGVAITVQAQSDGQTNVARVEKATSVRTSDTPADGQINVVAVEKKTSVNSSDVPADARPDKIESTKADSNAGKTFTSSEERAAELKKIAEQTKTTNSSRVNAEERKVRIAEYKKSQGESTSVVYPQEAELKAIQQERRVRATQKNTSTPN